MTLRGLVFIALRIYAIIFAAQIIPVLPMLVMYAVRAYGESDWLIRSTNLIDLFTPLPYLIVPFVLWFASGKMALAVAREYNPEIRFNLTLEDALAFAFVLLGLYLALNSIGLVVARFIHLTMVSDTSPAYPKSTEDPRTRAMLDFIAPAISLTAGLASMLGSRTWARRLARRSTVAEPAQS